jgi:uncharacterized NAD(P)/FAD-binding protein YdhS
VTVAGAAQPMRVAIVGGGFSGAVTAVHLARNASLPIDIHVLEPRDMLGRGVAYSATDPSHRINVPANRMTVFARDPAHFDRWLRAHEGLSDDAAAAWWTDESAFPQRGVFGRYITELVAEAGVATPGVTIHHDRTTVQDIALGSDGFWLRLQNGDPLRADIVVLAVSHPPPAVPAPLRAAQAAGAPVIDDPWRPGALDGIPSDARVLVIGTGLTMVDVVSSLEGRGHRGPIVAVSRRGLLPRGHSFRDGTKRNWFSGSPPCYTALELCRAVRAEIRAAAREGVSWQAVIDDVRSNARRLWASLNVVERRRLLQHVRPYWDVHRFRIAPQAEATISSMRASGQFTSLAASLRGSTWDGARIRVPVHKRGTAVGDIIEIEADAVIVTTGPAHNGVIAANPGLASLARAGLVRADATGLGLDVDAFNRAIGADGVAVPALFVVGPLARGQIGELMGVPEVSVHAEEVAATALKTASVIATEREGAHREANRSTTLAFPTGS